MDEDIEGACMAAVLAVFPEICPDYLTRIAGECDYDAESVISFIADEAENGRSYPKRQKSILKRKRDSDNDNDEDVARKFDSEDRHQEQKPAAYTMLSRTLLMQAFPRVLRKDVYQVLERKHYCLFPAYLELDRLLHENEEEMLPLPFTLKKNSTPQRYQYSRASLDDTIRNAINPQEKGVLEEYRAAIQVCEAREVARKAERQRQREEVENLEKARAEGSTSECGCCFDEFALNRMVHCDGQVFHYFCRGCARTLAENQIGCSRYELACMSVDSCSSGFSRDQRDLFLDEKMTIALERIEQEAVLRMAGIENLETCPLCPFAAEYPVVEENKEFRCENPECLMVSCRLCRRETHIPKTCEEFAREEGHSARRVIEEAMSAALIRKCNKCNTPFIKENGCNKMTCSRPGCANVQCYVCHKSCGYSHFDDTSRGGKAGNCPLFESVEKRHEDEVRAAEEEARKKVAEENPEVEADVLEIKVSEKVKDDERRRVERDPRANRAAVGFHGLLGGRLILQHPPQQELNGIEAGMGMIDEQLAQLGRLRGAVGPPPRPPWMQNNAGLNGEPNILNQQLDEARRMYRERMLRRTQHADPQDPYPEYKAPIPPVLNNIVGMRATGNIPVGGNIPDLIMPPFDFPARPAKVVRFADPPAFGDGQFDEYFPKQLAPQPDPAARLARAVHLADPPGFGDGQFNGYFPNQLAPAPNSADRLVGVARFALPPSFGDEQFDEYSPNQIMPPPDPAVHWGKETHVLRPPYFGDGGLGQNRHVVPFAPQFRTPLAQLPTLLPEPARIVPAAEGNGGRPRRHVEWAGAEIPVIDLTD